MRLLFVHEVNWHKKIVYEIHDFPELLSLRGHHVVFVDFPEAVRRRGLRGLLDLRTDIARGCARAHPGATVEVRTPGRVLAPPLDRLAASVTQVPVLWRALSTENYDAVVLYAVPTNGWQSILIARHFGVPVLFRAIDVSHRLRKSMFNTLVRHAERFVYRRADALSANNEALLRYCVEEGAEESSASVDYPIVDLERFHPGSRSVDLCRRYGVEPHHKIALFMGTLYRFAGLEWLVDSIAPLLQRRPELRLVLVGGGEAELLLRERIARSLPAGRVILTGFADYEELADHLRLADVALNTFRPSTVTDCALPIKVLQYLACGLPTVSTPLRGLRAMLPGESEGVAYQDLGPGFVGEVERLLTDHRRRRKMAAAGRGAVERLCRQETSVAAFEGAIRRAIGRRAQRRN